MDVKELSDRLATALEGVPEGEREVFLRGWICNLPAEEQAPATAIYGIFRSKVPPKSKHILVLVHGIRTAAVWHDLVQEVFEPTEIRVIPIGYEYRDVVRFLSPFGRAGVVIYVQDQLRQVRADYPHAVISLIAHSFGTFIVSRILHSSSGYRLSKIIFCGSIVDAKFPWGQIQELPERSKFMNEVGFRDAWPVLARSSSWGYGTSGSFGFKQVKVTDRYHDLDHGGFFDREWIEKFWLSFIRDDQHTPSGFSRSNPPYWLQLLTVIHIKYVVLAVLVGFLLYFRPWASYFGN
jgi:hypothetical protein